MAGGLVVGAGVSYLLVQWSRTGGLAKSFPAADWAPWLWVAALAAMALMLAFSWYRFGRGVCAAVSMGFVAAAAITVRDGHARPVPPLMAVAAACVVAVALGGWIEERVRRPT